MCFDTFPGAVAELGWRFQHAESAIGIHAQSIGDGGSHHVFDSAEETAEDFYAPTASSRLHLGKRKDAHRYAVSKMVKIDATLAECGHVNTLRLAFGTSGRGSKGLIETFTAHDNGLGVRVCLLATAITLPATRGEFERDGKNRQDGDSIVDWLERIRRSRDNLLHQLRTVAEKRIEPAIADYDAARERRLTVERAAREKRDAERAQYGESVRAEREERDRARFARRMGHVHASHHEALRARVAAMS